MIMVYRLCKSKIEKKMYGSKEEMQQMLDVFLAGDRLSFEEYDELTNLLNAQQSAIAQRLKTHEVQIAT